MESKNRCGTEIHQACERLTVDKYVQIKYFITDAQVEMSNNLLNSNANIIIFGKT